jgi:hypothetical protein
LVQALPDFDTRLRRVLSRGLFGEFATANLDCFGSTLLQTRTELITALARRLYQDFGWFDDAHAPPCPSSAGLSTGATESCAAAVSEAVV